MSVGNHLQIFQIQSKLKSCTTASHHTKVQTIGAIITRLNNLLGTSFLLKKKKKTDKDHGRREVLEGESETKEE